MWTIGLPSGTENFLGMSETGPTYPTARFTTDQDEEEEEAAFLTPLTAASHKAYFLESRDPSPLLSRYHTGRKELTKTTPLTAAFPPRYSVE